MGYTSPTNHTIKLQEGNTVPQEVLDTPARSTRSPASARLGRAGHLCLVALLGTSAGCTGTTPYIRGSAGSEPSRTQNSAPSSSTPPATAKPPSTRPREIKLDGRNPCELLTLDQIDRIGKTTAPQPSTNDTFKSPECMFNATGAFWRVTTVLTEGIDAWTDRKRQGQPADIPPIAGFPAITITLAGHELTCTIAVDVADGQYLYSMFEVSVSFTDRFPKPCDGARLVADAAMRNLTN